MRVFISNVASDEDDDDFDLPEMTIGDLMPKSKVPVERGFKFEEEEWPEDEDDEANYSGQEGGSDSI